EVRASAAPAQALLDDLRETSADFDELRVALLEEASAFAGAPDPARIRTLKALGALVSALERVEAERARRTAWEAARENALGVLDRVMTLIHREDKDASALADGQAKARELHAALSAAEPADVDGRRVGGAAPAAGGVPVTGGVPAGGGRSVGPRGPALVPPPAVVVTTPGGVVTSGSPPVVAGGRVAPPGSPLVVEIRLSGERVQVETPEQRREREELLERLAEETAQWWVGARRGWESLVQRRLAPAEAARDTLERFPYLLSVPLA